MGKPVMPYRVDLVGEDGLPTPVGEPGEIVLHTEDGDPCGLFQGYYRDEAQTRQAHHDGLFHTGDLAWRDEDGYYFYVGRKDDVIKTSGYRVGPFEIESVIMERPKRSKRRSRTTSSPTPRRTSIRASWCSAINCPKRRAERSSGTCCNELFSLVTLTISYMI